MMHTTPPSGAGRPTKYCTSAVKTICDAIADGVPFVHASALGGITHETLCQWRRRYPEFAEAVQAAVAEGIKARLEIIVEASKQDAKHAQWWLEHVLPEHFAKNRIEIQHEGSLEHTLTIPEATINEIAKARREYEEKRDMERA